MTINSTYTSYLIEKAVKSLIKQGQLPNMSSITAQVTSDTGSSALTSPRFAAATYYAYRLESASASVWNTMSEMIKDDLTVLYREVFSLSKNILRSKGRWQYMAEQLEGELLTLENTADVLLAFSTNRSTEHWLNYIVEYFVDGQKVDFTNTTADVDLSVREVTLPAASSAQSRILLNNLDLASDVFFNIRSRSNVVGQRFSNNSDLTDPFHQTSKGWWTEVITNKQTPLTVEILVKLGDEATSLSRIFIDLLDSNQAGSVFITPLYSTDNVTYRQLPGNTYTQEVKDKATFSFSSVSAQWVKFIITKVGSDVAEGDKFSYQFGFSNIEFYNATYTSTAKSLISKALSVEENGSVVPFTRLAIDVCEITDDDTDIEYSVSTSNTANFVVDSTTVWFPITPDNHLSGAHPKRLVVGEVIRTTIGVDEDVYVSYADGDSGYTNPGSPFHILSKNASTGAIVDSTVSGIADRYLFSNPNDRILNYQIKTDDYTDSAALTGEILGFDEYTLTVFRNVGEQALDKSVSTDRVRDVQRGWRFEDPYYITTVRVNNPNGLSIDVGPNPIIIDGVEYTHRVGASVLSGKSGKRTGVHVVKVNKTNWKHVASGYTTAQLKAADVLYPYNQKLLVEGYSYSTSNTGVEIYKGVDLFCGQKMKKVSHHDFINNVDQEDYSRFATDVDMPGTHRYGNEGTTVFLVKVDDTNPDFVNEKFIIEFDAVKSTKSYVRLKAKLSTQDTGQTPVLGGYRIKLA